MSIGIFITVRLGSTRLPGKACLPLGGRPALSYLIERTLENIKGLAVSPILCTTELEEDNKLADLADRYGIGCFRGDPNNILLRHRQCAARHGIEFIINLDGDDIFCNVEQIPRIYEEYIKEQYDIVYTHWFPLGTNVYAYKPELLDEALKRAGRESLNTGWTDYLFDQKGKRVKVLQALPEERGDYRLTMDYEEDRVLFASIVKHCWISGRYLAQKEILRFLRENPEMASVNRHLDQIYWSNFHQNKQIERGRHE